MKTADYEMVIGLEVHAELKTETKIFCDCKTEFGAEPNTQCCPVCMGMPGTLPVLNEKVVEFAVKAGLATGCDIAPYSKQDRKNYFYPDLPKAYQISQFDLPLCVGGKVEIESADGPKEVGITRIHIEEDAGKLVHQSDGSTLADYNRCGVPLIEIVSEPDMRSAEEAVAYLRKLRAILLYIDVCDGKMQEGSLRCDVNLSVRKRGSEELGTRTEMKNLNSFTFVAKAIAYEFERQVAAVEAGEEIVQETRRFDENSGKTGSMRSKENANDYRYFPDPDLVPIELDKACIDSLKSAIPELPDERKAKYKDAFGLAAADAELLVQSRTVADYFEAAAGETKHVRTLANLLIGEGFRLLGEGEEIPILPTHMAGLADLLGDGKIAGSTAKKLLAMLWKEDGDPLPIVKRENLYLIASEEALLPVIAAVIAASEKVVADYHSGKDRALQALIGQVMGRTGGRAEPRLTAKLLKRELDK